MGELTQNADDAGGAEIIRFEVTPGAFIVSNDGEFSKCGDVGTEVCEWRTKKEGHRCDFHSFREVASGDKEGRSGPTTGAFGIGFTSVYQITDRPELYSNGEHWILDEAADESKRIKRTAGVTTKGTQFVLPWARDDTSMRRSIAQPLVTNSRIDELTADLFDVAPELLLFLLRLSSLKVVANGQEAEFKTRAHNNVITIERDDGSSRRWLILTSDLGEAAGQLINAYPNLIHSKRPTAVKVAIELDAEPAPGSYFVTLPTEQSTELPISVNGSFFPKPDRKRIRLDDDPEGTWNRAIIACAAQLVANSLEQLAAEVGDEWIVRLLSDAYRLSERVAIGSAEAAHGLWWDRLLETLPSQRIVPAITGGYGTLSEVCLTNDDARESPAASVLAKLGVWLIATEVRNAWFRLSSDARLGLKPLRLSVLTAALQARQRDMPVPWIGVHLSSDELEIFWTVAEHLTAEQRSSRDSRYAAARLPIVPLRDGTIVAPKDAIRVRAGERPILIDGGLVAPLLDERFAKQFHELSGLTLELIPLRMAEFARDAFSAGSVPETFDRARLLDWFANRDDESVELGRDWFDQLPIFPTGEGFQTARELVLPVEGFNSPLRMENLFITQSRPAVVRPFLERLGVPSLDLVHFCTDLVPKAVKQGLSTAGLNDLVLFLARHVSQIREDEGVRLALSDLALVLCQDNVVRRGCGVYSGSVNALVVGQRPVAAAFGGQLVTDFFGWLGVANQPRAADVVEYGLTLSSSSWDHLDSVAAILHHLQGLDRKVLDSSYSALQTEPWLPVLHATDPARPTDVFTTFQQYLFSSQARFLGVPPRVQQGTSLALEWLGVKTEPPTELVVKHLLAAVPEGSAVNREVWVFLNRHAEDPAIDELVGKRCIHVEGRGYVHPSHCFWDSNPFDRHRLLLSPDFRQFQQLFDRLGVRESPNADDVVEVLGDIASAHGGAKQALLEHDIPIVQNCWVFLDKLVRGHSVTKQQIDELKRTECVLDSSSWLRRPSEVLYRDASQIAKQLSPAASARLIARPDNIKAALDVVGVRHLRRALVTTIVDLDDRPDPSKFKAHIADRRNALARVLDRFVEAPLALLDQFLESTYVRSLYRLTVVEHLDLEGAPHDPAPSDRAALWDDTTHEFLLVGGSPTWPEIAREFALSLGIEGEDVAQVAVAMLNTLRALSVEEASEELDLLGYSDVEEAIAPGLETVVSGMEPGYSGTPEDFAPRVDVSMTGGPKQVGPSERADGSTAQEASTGAAQLSQSSESVAPSTEPSTASLARGSSEAGVSSSSLKTGSSGNRGVSGTQPQRSELQRLKPRQRLLSYVKPGGGDGSASEAEPDDKRSETDAAAIEAVLAFERSMGREPEPMDHSNPGFDVKSFEPDGSVRYIEVKGTALAWDDLGVGITGRQYQEACERGEQYWLYVVVVTADGPSEPFRIQNPASRIDRYYFDGGWRSAAEQSVAHFKELPAVTTYADPSELASPVQLVSYVDGSDTGTWLPCPPDCLDQMGAGLFAVRIAAETVGLLYRGGVAFAVPTDEVQDRDPVVVRLLDRVDPETGGVITVRYFGEELSAAGRRVGARLETDTGVPPITIDDVASIEILGRLIYKLLPE